MNEVALIDSPIMNDTRRFEIIKGGFKFTLEIAQRCVAASASVADRLNARGEVLGVAFKPKLQPSRQILLAELLAAFPIV
jgi:hypothetical protein